MIQPKISCGESQTYILVYSIGYTRLRAISINSSSVFKVFRNELHTSQKHIQHVLKNLLDDNFFLHPLTKSKRIRNNQNVLLKSGKLSCGIRDLLLRSYTCVE